MLNSNGQNDFGEPLKRGKPSEDMFISMVILDFIFAKARDKECCKPLCQYLPPARVEISTVRGVFNSALQSFGRNVIPKDFKILRSAVNALIVMV